MPQTEIRSKLRPPFFLRARPRTLRAVDPLKPAAASERLRTGAQALGVTLDAAQCEQMLLYLQLLNKWNRAMDLTAIDTIDDAIPWHLLDSLAGAPYADGQRWLDVGSGAGLPGLPLAIAHPQRQVVLLDSRQKRSQFLLYVTGELGLSNVSVVTARVETYRPESKFDTLLARAFAAIPKLLRNTVHLCRPQCRILVWKGARPDKELETIAERPNTKVEVYPIDVPGLAAERHLVSITLSACAPGAD